MNLTFPVTVNVSKVVDLLNLITYDTCADIFMFETKTAPRLPNGFNKNWYYYIIYGNTIILGIEIFALICGVPMTRTSVLIVCI